MFSFDKHGPKAPHDMCMHSVSISLASQLPEPLICPPCTINRHVRSIQDVQRELSDCGGAFKSKEDNISRHKSLRKVWRDAKIALANAVAKFEDLVGQSDTREQDMVQLREALEIWESKKVTLSRVPGVAYTEGAEENEPSDEDQEIARLMMELLKMALEKEVTTEEKQEFAKLTLRGPYQEEASNRLHRPQSAAQSAAPELRLSPSPSPSSEPRQDIFTALRTGCPEPAAETQHAQPATPEPSSSPGTDRPKIATRKPILKRCASKSPPSSPTSSSQHKHKRVRTASFVTISPEALSIANPSPFASLSRTPTVQPHAHHTIAENKRRSSAFHRTSMPYMPGAWASGAFSEKANTSYLGVKWDVMDNKIKEELGEENTEKRLAAELKMISGQWVTSWWIKNIAPALDVEQLMAAMKSEER